MDDLCAEMASQLHVDQTELEQLCDLLLRLQHEPPSKKLFDDVTAMTARYLEYLAFNDHYPDEELIHTHLVKSMELSKENMVASLENARVAYEHIYEHVSRSHDQDEQINADYLPDA